VNIVKKRLRSKKNPPSSTMQWTLVAIAAFAILSAGSVRAFDETVEEEDAGDARLGFVTVNSDGTTSLTFNATSIQNAVILGLFIIILGALLVPLFGGAISGGSSGSGSGYGYGGGYEQPQAAAYQAGSYEQPSSGYNNFAKRSAEFLSPVLAALSTGYKKYNGQDEE
jgi:hypothetical protein